MRLGWLIFLVCWIQPLAAQNMAAADSAWQRGDTGAAEKLYADILAADPANAIALHRLALLHAWRNQFSESFALFDRLLHVEPANSSARLDRARVLGFANRFGAAIAVYDSMLARDPNAVGALQGKALMFAWSGELLRAEAAWRRALQADERNTTSLVGLAQTLRWQGRPAAALPYLESALANDSTDRSAREQLAWVNASLAPRVSPSFTAENDSDGNRIRNSRFSAAFRPWRQTEVSADAYFRDTRATFPSDPKQARGAVIGVRQYFEPGWSVFGSVGGSDTESRTDGSFSAARFAVATPPRNRVTGDVSYAYNALDATALLIHNGVTSRELAAAAATSVAPLGSISAGASVTWLHAQSSDITNRRLSGSLALTRRLSRPLLVGVSTRVFGFEQDVQDGYFDPDFFATAEILGRLRREGSRVGLSAELAPGVQQVGSGGDIKGTFRATGRASYTFAIGRVLEVFALYANSGLNQLSQSSDAGYEYRAFGVSANWIF